MMNITYEDGSGLYVNLTNRCNNHCEFCVRAQADGYYGDLWLEREPTVEEAFASIMERRLSRYSELVFCGYGEPTMRLYDMLEIIDRVRAREPDVKIRLNTNGLANLLYQKDVTPDFAGRLDEISISLNTPDAAAYEALCHSDYGEAAHAALILFARLAKRHVPSVILSVVDQTISKEEVEACRRIAGECGVQLRVREMID